MKCLFLCVFWVGPLLKAHPIFTLCNWLFFVIVDMALMQYHLLGHLRQANKPPPESPRPSTTSFPQEPNKPDSQTNRPNLSRMLTYWCRKCGIKFTSKIARRNHFQKFHPAIPKGEFICGYCSQRSVKEHLNCYTSIPSCQHSA